MDLVFIINISCDFDCLLQERCLCIDAVYALISRWLISGVYFKRLSWNYLANLLEYFLRRLCWYHLDVLCGRSWYGILWKDSNVKPSAIKIFKGRNRKRKLERKSKWNDWTKSTDFHLLSLFLTSNSFRASIQIELSLLFAWWGI